MSELSDCTVGASAFTTMLSVIAPVVSLTSRAEVVATCTRIPVRVVTLNPGALTVMS